MSKMKISLIYVVTVFALLGLCGCGSDNQELKQMNINEISDVTEQYLETTDSTEQYSETTDITELYLEIEDVAELYSETTEAEHYYDNKDLLEQYRIRGSIEDNAYYVDKSLIVYSDELDYERAKYDEAFSEFISEYEVDSCVVVKTASYLDYWYRWYAVYLPIFTDEIPYEEGREKIQQYYCTLADKEANAAQEWIKNAFTDGGTVYYSDTSHLQGMFYSISYVGDYLSVEYSSFDYTGGAHPGHSNTTDNFDMRTGALLKTADVFAAGEDADLLLQSCIEKYADPDDDSPYQVQINDSLTYYFAEEGVTFLFNPYEFGSWTDGLREITIPYEELQSILLIDIL